MCRFEVMCPAAATHRLCSWHSVAQVSEDYSIFDVYKLGLPADAEAPKPRRPSVDAVLETIFAKDQAALAEKLHDAETEAQVPPK